MHVCTFRLKKMISTEIRVKVTPARSFTLTGILSLVSWDISSMKECYWSWFPSFSPGGLKPSLSGFGRCCAFTTLSLLCSRAPLWCSTANNSIVPCSHKNRLCYTTLLPPYGIIISYRHVIAQKGPNLAHFSGLTYHTSLSFHLKKHTL